MTTIAITPWYSRPRAILTDFIFTKRYVEKLAIIGKIDGVAMPAEVPFNNSIGYGIAAHFVFVMTRFGDLRIEVSKEVFDLLTIGESVIVSYRRGRWTKALEGKIAN
jgi:hypothetical protein